MAGRQVEKLPPGDLLRLSMAKLAALLDLAESTIYDATTWHDHVRGVIEFPGTPPIPVQRSAENGHAFVWRRHVDRAVDDAYRSGRPMPPPPLELSETGEQGHAR